jgi:2-polyprenyl-3-methyl-5-hydroxy-6-metoxy-1,4-benzoquinol methylase
VRVGSGTRRAADGIPKCTQLEQYNDFYGKNDFIKRMFRFDVRYRCRRLREILRELRIDCEGARVLDFGFGRGELLATFPASARLRGVDVSPSAVAAAREDTRFDRFAEAEFATVPERDFNAIFDEEFDLILSSHVIEHVYNDVALLRALRSRLAARGHLVLFAPIEEPGYIRYHVRNYSLQSIRDKVTSAGFEIVAVEGSMHINGHLWKLLTIPSRRGWPVIGPLVDGLRLFMLSLLSYAAVRLLDGLLDRLGFGPRQVLVVARRPRNTSEATATPASLSFDIVREGSGIIAEDIL